MRPKAGPRAGDRLPDAPIQRDGRATHLQQELSGPAFHLLLCGSIDDWDSGFVDGLISLRITPPALAARYLSRENRPGVLFDPSGDALSQLGVSDGQSGQYLVRPDGYIAFRCAGRRLDDVAEYLRRWLIVSPARPA